jgi:malate/lactate dehydrogenase
MDSQNNIIKYVINTDNNKIYSLYVMEANEYQKGKFIGLFIYYDENGVETKEKLWMNLRHRILYENSVEAVKNKVIEYADGKNEKLSFLEFQTDLVLQN